MQKKPALFQKFAAVFADGSRFMQIVGAILTLAVLNISCLLCMLAIITGGGALTALYTLLPEVKGLSFDHAFIQFFRLVRAHWKQTLLCWLAVLVVGGVLVSAWRVALLLELTNQFLLMLPLMLVTAIALFCLLWLFPVLSVQEDAPWTSSVRQAFLLSLRELPRSLALLVLEAGIFLLALWCSASLARIGLWLFFGLTPLCYLKAQLLYTVLHPAESK